MIVIPIVVRTTEDMLRLIPVTLREAAIALGAPKWKMILFICYRAARHGIVTGILLAIARIAGETAPLLFTSLGNLNWSRRPRQADGEPAGHHLSIRRVGVPGLGPACLGRRAADHGRRAGDQHRRADVCCAAASEARMAMSTTGTRIRARQQIMGGMTGQPDAGLNPPRMSIRNLDFFYGEHRALKGINLDLPDRQVTGMIGPSGCGKSTLLRVLNRMYDLYPGQRADRRGDDGRREHHRAGRGPERAAVAHRHGVPEADAVPDVDLRQHRVRREAARAAVQGGRWTSGSSGR